MKCAIVSSAALTKYGRMDPGFYLGQVEGQEANERIARAEKQLQAAITRLRRAFADKRAADVRQAQMIANKEIVPYG